MKPQRPRTAKLPTEPPAGSAGLEVVGLCRYFGGQAAVDDVSFSVPAGGVCTILGASGSGKTTTLRLIAGLDRPDAGTIWLCGQQVAGSGVTVPPERRDIGLVFQSYALWPHMKVHEQIAYPLRVRHMRRDAIREAVDRAARMVGLNHLLDRYPSQLSGGQQQRVALARAIVFGPRLLLLDEPLSGLDAALRRQTRMELEDLQRRVNVTTVYVTHDQEEAMAVSDLVVVMRDGRVVSTGSPQSMYSQPNSVYVASFVGASNLIAGTIVGSARGLTTLAIADGSVITGVSHRSCEPDSKATLAIKPVDVIVHRGQGPSHNDNMLAGRVASATYLGPNVELTVIAAGIEVRAPVPRGWSLAPGDDVVLELPRDLVTVIPDEDIDHVQEDPAAAPEPFASPSPESAMAKPEKAHHDSERQAVRRKERYGQV